MQSWRTFATSLGSPLHSQINKSSLKKKRTFHFVIQPMYCTVHYVRVACLLRLQTKACVPQRHADCFWNTDKNNNDYCSSILCSLSPSTTCKRLEDATKGRTCFREALEQWETVDDWYFRCIKHLMNQDSKKGFIVPTGLNAN